MNQSIPDAPKENTKKANNIIWVIIPVLVIAIAAVIFFIPTGLDKAVVKQQLDNFALQVKQKASEHGQQAEFTYQDIRVESGGSGKYAVIEKPTIAVNEDGKLMLISSPEVNIFPESADLKDFRVEIPQQIQFTEKDTEFLRVELASPLLLEIQQEDERFNTQATLPTSLKIIPESNPDEIVTVTYDAPEKITSVVSKQGQALESNMKLSNIRVTDSSDKSVAAVRVFSIALTNDPLEDSRRDVSYQFEINDFIVPESEEEFLREPVNMSLDVGFIGELPDADSQEPIAFDKEMKLMVKSINLDTAPFGLNIAGNVLASPEDMMPSGAFDIQFRNLPGVLESLKEQDAIGEAEVSMVFAMLHLIAGQGWEQKEKVDIKLSREPMAEDITIGQTTFNNLLMAMMDPSLMAPPSSGGNEVSPAEPAPLPAE